MLKVSFCFFNFIYSLDHFANGVLKYLQENNNYNQPSILVIPLKRHLSESLTILFKMDNDELTGLVFVDFHKAFHVLNHNLLLKKLSVYGASPESVA